MNSAQRRVRFGVFEADLGRGEIRKHGRHLGLQQQPFRVLSILLERAGEVVSREEVQKSVWPADTFVDFDYGLNTAIKKIRLALSDSADAPRFIETLPRVGYRFIAPVTWEMPQETGSDITSGPVSPVATRNEVVQVRSRRFAFASLAGLLAVNLAIAVIWGRRPVSAPPTYVPVPLTTYPGEELQPAFSPDARQVAFIGDGDTPEQFSIYTQVLGGGASIRITRTAAKDVSPAWSPDGRKIAFIRISGGSHAEVFVVPSTGGPEIRVAGLHEGGLSRPWMVPRSWLTWTPDGSGLVVADMDEGGSRYSLFLVRLGYAQRWQLTTASADSWDSAPAFAPDGTSLAFIRSLFDLDGDVFVLPLTAGFAPAGEPRRITSLHRLTSGLTWTRDGHDVVFASGQIGASHLWRVPAIGGAEPRLLQLVAENALWPAISSAGHLAYVVSQSDADIWHTPLDGSGAAHRLIASTRDEVDAQYSPDGRRILFTSTRSGNSEIWIANADGSDPSQLTNLRAFFIEWPHWSPDGSTIVFDSPRDGRFSVYVVGVAGGTVRKLTDGSAPCAAGSYSRDGRWIYYHCIEHGTHQIWRTPAQSGKSERVVPGFAQLESLDGRYLYFVRHSITGKTRPLWRMPVEGGEPVQILPDVEPFTYAVASDGIVFRNGAPDEHGRWVIQYLHLASGHISTVASYSGLANSGMSISPDEKWLLYSYDERRNADLMLLEGFR